MVPASGAVKGAVPTAVRALEQAGMGPVAAAPAGRRHAVLGWNAYLRADERQAIAAGFGGGAAWSLASELWRALRGQPRITPGSLFYWAGAELSSRMLNALGVDGARWRERLRGELIDMIGERGVAVSPIFPTSAPRPAVARRAMFLAMGYQAWVNLAGLPGLTVPVGRSGSGLPVGVQIVGAPGPSARSWRPGRRSRGSAKEAAC